MNHPLWDEIGKRHQTAKEVIEFDDLYSPEAKLESQTVSNQILFGKRQFIIWKVKWPLMKTLESFGQMSWWKRPLALFKMLKLIKSYPNPTYENTRHANTHPTLKIIDKFFMFENNKDRAGLFKAIYRLAVCEFEHDLYYASRRDWWIEQIILAILDGTWQPRLEGQPDPRWWKEPAPYGGKYSIVYKMWKHRAEIKKILEES
jgi:hypothetical protein